MGQDSSRAALIYQHASRLVDQTIDAKLSALIEGSGSAVEDEDPDDGEGYGPCSALKPFAIDQRVWCVRQIGPCIVVGAHLKGVEGVAWSPDGNRIASASQDATCRIWDATISIEDLVAKAHRSVSRKLTAEERQDLMLPSTVSQYPTANSTPSNLTVNSKGSGQPRTLHNLGFYGGAGDGNRTRV